jgi:cyclic pyranopterin phosphate synthase
MFTKRLFSTFVKARPNYKHPVPANAKWSKLTNEPILQDSFGRFHNYLRISLTERCNFNCVYCVYDQDIQYTPKPELLSYEELVRLTKLFVHAGVDKIRLTGGDPLMYKKLPEFIKEIEPKTCSTHIRLLKNT